MYLIIGKIETGYELVSSWYSNRQPGGYQILKKGSRTELKKLAESIRGEDTIVYEDHLRK